MNDLIQWPCAKWWEKQWNPVIGCKPISPACENCYAAAWAKRFGQSFEPHRTKQRPPRKGVVFCGNMTDLFGEWEYSPSRFYVDIVSKKSNATYLWLTKRVSRMCDAVCEMSICADWRRTLNSNHYFGFTAENQEWYEKRIEPFLDSFPKWAQAWVSAEPLLGHLGFMFQNSAIREKIRWVVVGCESGRNRRKCPIDYIEDVVEQCQRFNVPVFVKQICLPNGKFTNKIEEFPQHLQVRQVPWNTKGVRNEDDDMEAEGAR